MTIVETFEKFTKRIREEQLAFPHTLKIGTKASKLKSFISSFLFCLVFINSNKQKSL